MKNKTPKNKKKIFSFSSSERICNFWAIKKILVRRWWALKQVKWKNNGLRLFYRERWKTIVLHRFIRVRFDLWNRDHLRAVGKCPPCRCCCSEPPGKRKRSSDLRIRVTRGGATHLSSRQRLSAFLHRFPGSLDDFLKMPLKRDLASLIVLLIAARDN